MPPFGGPTVHGFELTDEARDSTRRTFRGGDAPVEVDIEAAYVGDRPRGAGRGRAAGGPGRRPAAAGLVAPGDAGLPPRGRRVAAGAPARGRAGAPDRLDHPVPRWPAAESACVDADEHGAPRSTITARCRAGRVWTGGPDRVPLDPTPGPGRGHRAPCGSTKPRGRSRFRKPVRRPPSTSLSTIRRTYASGSAGAPVPSWSRPRECVLQSSSAAARSPETANASRYSRADEARKNSANSCSVGCTPS